MIVKRTLKKENAYSFYEYLQHLKLLSNFNVGGVPLHLIAGSSWFAPTNCELLARWFAHVVPDGMVVEGTTAQYIEEAKNSPNPPYKWAGFHVWIEYLDEFNQEKVLDPCSFLVFNKDYFYQEEDAKVVSKTPCPQFESQFLNPATNNMNADKFDVYRLGFLMNMISHFTSTDFGFFKDDIDGWAQEFEKSNKLEEYRQEYIDNYVADSDKDINTMVFELFDNPKDFDGQRFFEQQFLMCQLSGRLQSLKEMGFMDEEEKLTLPEELEEKPATFKQKNDED